MNLSPLELQLLSCVREYRRLSNQGCKEVVESDACHIEADRLLAIQPELDDASEHYDAPNRVEHRRFIDSLFRRDRGF